MTIVDPMSVIGRYKDHTPVPVFDILSELGLGPDFRHLSNNVSGWIERQSDGLYKVVINLSHPSTRQRFTAAHELAHYVYHRDLLGAGVGDNRAYRAEGTPIQNDKITPRHERQANSVAANILMPREAVSRLCSQGITNPRALAERFGVSEDAMRIRLGLPRLPSKPSVRP